MYKIISIFRTTPKPYTTKTAYIRILSVQVSTERDPVFKEIEEELNTWVLINLFTRASQTGGWFDVSFDDLELSQLSKKLGWNVLHMTAYLGNSAKFSDAISAVLASNRQDPKDIHDDVLRRKFTYANKLLKVSTGENSQETEPTELDVPESQDFLRRTREGFTPVHFMCMTGDRNIATYLLEQPNPSRAVIVTESRMAAIFEQSYEDRIPDPLELALARDHINVAGMIINSLSKTAEGQEILKRRLPHYHRVVVRYHSSRFEIAYHILEFERTGNLNTTSTELYWAVNEKEKKPDQEDERSLEILKSLRLTLLEAWMKETGNGTLVVSCAPYALSAELLKSLITERKDIGTTWFRQNLAELVDKVGISGKIDLIIQILDIILMKTLKDELNKLVKVVSIDLSDITREDNPELDGLSTNRLPPNRGLNREQKNIVTIVKHLIEIKDLYQERDRIISHLLATLATTNQPDVYQQLLVYLAINIPQEQLQSHIENVLNGLDSSDLRSTVSIFLISFETMRVNNLEIPSSWPDPYNLKPFFHGQSRDASTQETLDTAFNRVCQGQKIKRSARMEKAIRFGCHSFFMTQENRSAWNDLDGEKQLKLIHVLVRNDALTLFLDLSSDVQLLKSTYESRTTLMSTMRVSPEQGEGRENKLYRPAFKIFFYILGKLKEMGDTIQIRYLNSTDSEGYTILHYLLFKLDECIKQGHQSYADGVVNAIWKVLAINPGLFEISGTNTATGQKQLTPRDLLNGKKYGDLCDHLEDILEINYIPRTLKYEPLYTSDKGETV